MTCSKKHLNDLKHHRSCSDGDRVALGVLLRRNAIAASSNKQNFIPKMKQNVASHDKENTVPNNGSSAAAPKQFLDMRSSSTGGVLKPSSLQLCMQLNELNSNFGSQMKEPTSSEDKNSVNVWDYSDSDAAPASSWSTLPNRSLLCRPLPLDVGKCTCVIVKEEPPDGLGGTLYSLYTNEGKGRQDRKLAVAHHRWRNGKSEFTVAQNTKGIIGCSDDSFIGTVTANFFGSKYHIWDQGSRLNSMTKQSKLLLAAVTFMPTIATCTGSYRGIRAWIPKHHSMQLKNTTQIKHIIGLPNDSKGRMGKVHQLFSRVPSYNRVSKQYELDFRDRGRGLKVKRSVKNFQMTLEENGRQTILQLGRVGKSKYVMDYRHPLTGYQAFCLCLASIDSKLCCTV
ncbi:tubby-like protein 8 [Malania oleifera]|uniref:tubby-like protein 8 n=1 Tax=Malania oleifera TaxID=397392 RepID=UPI0025AE6C82|nr:tubby-like protein 8 [Malania oleifera]XP_057966885.1 tubby-like protein 8 [Malania oleifera]